MAPKKHDVPEELLAGLLANYKKPQDLIGENGLLKHQTRWADFDDKIISLCTHGVTVREIQSHLQEMYGTEVSTSLIFSVTDAVSDEVKALC